jgi:hypothetical protein
MLLNQWRKFLPSAVSDHVQVSVATWTNICQALNKPNVWSVAQSDLVLEYIRTIHESLGKHGTVEIIAEAVTSLLYIISQSSKANAILLCVSDVISVLNTTWKVRMSVWAVSHFITTMRAFCVEFVLYGHHIISISDLSTTRDTNRHSRAGRLSQILSRFCILFLLLPLLI